MGNVITLFKRSFSYIFKDPVNLVFTLIPVTIGIAIYSYGFYHLYDFVMGWLKGYLEGLATSNSIWLDIIYWLVKIILTILCFFLVNWTFVLIVSAIASPFNDLISERIEKKMKRTQLDSLGKNFSKLLSRMFFTIFNEFKKIMFIGILTLLALVFGYIPILTPFAFALTFLLVSIQFVDYTWSRHNLPFRSCVADVTKSIWHYLTAGALYFFFINIPLLNLFIPALATAHYTQFYNKDLNSQ